MQRNSKISFFLIGIFSNIADLSPVSQAALTADIESVQIGEGWFK
jgi:hypothetical protein